MIFEIQDLYMDRDTEELQPENELSRVSDDCDYVYYIITRVEKCPPVIMIFSYILAYEYIF